MALQISPSSFFHASACPCPVCSGKLQLVDEPGSPQAFLNADVRGGAAGGKTSFTVQEAANQLLRGEPGWGSMGQPFTVTYGFRSSAPTTMPDDAAGFSRFNAAQIVQTELALAGWSDVARISFVRAGSGSYGEGAYSDAATMLFANYSSGVGGASAFAFYPGATGFASSSGDVWVNIKAGSNSYPTVGNYGGQVLVHEIGHAIGLAHPGDYNAEEGKTFSYSGDAAYAEDSRQYTVMSYFSEFNTGANFGGVYSAAPLLDDIAAAQMAYGANMATRLGDTTYGFNSNAGRPWFEAAPGARVVFAVWDAGGKDTLDFSGFTSTQVIDLREGHFSNVGGLVGNVAVAVGAQIENAVGGSGADTMHGNALANALFGGAGNDLLRGEAGEDYLRGGAGHDQLWGGEAFDDVHGNMGNDTLWGGAGGDWVAGGQDTDLVYGEDGHDTVVGNMGNDTVHGGEGDDIVRGGKHDDVLYGGPGADWLSGDLGYDQITGGTGADTFNFFAGGGLDRVLDFAYGEGDRVRIEGGQAWVASGGQVSVSQQGADVVVALGADRMILVGVNISSLADDWIYLA